MDGEMNEVCSTLVRKRRYKLQSHDMEGGNHCYDLGVEDNSKMGQTNKVRGFTL
jgi:hypothetical protein